VKRNIENIGLARYLTAFLIGCHRAPVGRLRQGEQDRLLPAGQQVRGRLTLFSSLLFVSNPDPAFHKVSDTDSESVSRCISYNIY
jgi:hypothetical protein